MRWLLLIILLTGCSAIPLSAPPPQVERVPAGTLNAATARTSLAALQVSVPGRLDGYSRDCGDGACVFGQPWFDTDGDGCDQRSQVLTRDLTGVQRKPGRCGVQSGTLDDPYTGSQISGVSKIQIDHAVSAPATPFRGVFAGQAVSSILMTRALINSGRLTTMAA